MAITRKQILKKITAKRKAIEYHLNEHIPELINVADEDLIRYWRKEVGNLIDQMEQWALRLTKHDELLVETSAYRDRLEQALTRTEP